VSESIPPDAPRFTENYTGDRTQGPAASIGAAPAAIARVHAAFYDDEKPSSEWRQTADHQIELLGDLKEYFPVVNGYVVDLDKAEPLPKEKDELKKLSDRVKVAIHRDVDAPVCSYSGMQTEVVAEVPRVNQLFCAAVNVGQGFSGMANQAAPESRKKVMFILKADYRATYYAAAALGCKRIYLTMLGGGVFGNDKEDIADAIARVHEEFCKQGLHVALEEVRVTLYSDLPFNMRKAVLSHREGTYNYIEFDCSMDREIFTTANKEQLKKAMEKLDGGKEKGKEEKKEEPEKPKKKKDKKSKPGLSNLWGLLSFGGDEKEEKEEKEEKKPSEKKSSEKKPAEKKEEKKPAEKKEEKKEEKKPVEKKEEKKDSEKKGKGKEKKDK